MGFRFIHEEAVAICDAHAIGEMKIIGDFADRAVGDEMHDPPDDRAGLPGARKREVEPALAVAARCHWGRAEAAWSSLSWIAKVLPSGDDDRHFV